MTTEVVVGTYSGILKHIKVECGENEDKKKVINCKVLGVFGEADGNKIDCLCTYGSNKVFYGVSGVLKCLDVKKHMMIKDNLLEYSSNSWFNVISNQNSLFACNNFGEINILRNIEENMEEEEDKWTKFETKSNDLECFSVNNSFVAFGGKENDVKLWDLENQKLIWRAKNVKHNNYNIPYPVWVKTISFVNDSTILVGTGHHQIRLYDVRDGSGRRRPLQNVSYGNHPFTSSCITSSSSSSDNTDYAVLANSMGDLVKYDFRKGCVISCLKGTHGCQKDVITLPSSGNIFPGNLVLSTGLDRFLYVFNSKTDQLLSRLYLKQQALCVSLLDLEESTVSIHDDGNDDVKEKDEYGNLFDSLAKKSLKREMENSREIDDRKKFKK